jgi:hypothetical protein
MSITASKLRGNIYKILDEVIETGKPVEIERNGQILRLVLAEPVPKLLNLVQRPDFIRVSAEDFIHIDWSKEWKP